MTEVKSHPKNVTGDHEANIVAASNPGKAFAITIATQTLLSTIFHFPFNDFLAFYLEQDLAKMHVDDDDRWPIIRFGGGRFRLDSRADSISNAVRVDKNSNRRASILVHSGPNSNKFQIGFCGYFRLLLYCSVVLIAEIVVGNIFLPIMMIITATSNQQQSL